MIVTLVVIVARGHVTLEQVQRVAHLLNGASDEAARGPVAVVIDPDRVDFPIKFADITQDERPIQLVKSLHKARARHDRWRQAGWPPAVAARSRNTTIFREVLLPLNREAFTCLRSCSLAYQSFSWLAVAFISCC